MVSVQRDRMDKALLQLGWNSVWEKTFRDLNPVETEPGRVASASREKFLVIGRKAYGWLSARRRLLENTPTIDSLPCVGDWVLVRDREHEEVVEQILPRRTVFLRKAAGRTSEAQVIAANIDRVFLVTTVGNDFNPRRIERYLSLIWSSGAEPVVVVNKVDQSHDRNELKMKLEDVALGVNSVWVSALTRNGIDELRILCGHGRTIAFLGSSGVGKSTLINRLLGEDRQETSGVRSKDEKGRHTTSNQELHLMKGGAILIDTPGMRELGLLSAGEGLEQTFADILEVAVACRFKDCTHQQEHGCAVSQAVREGKLSRARVDNYIRLQRELEVNRERACAHNSKRRWKQISTVSKNMKKLHRKLGLK